MIVANGLRRGLECTCRGGSGFKSPADGSILAGVERLVDEFLWEQGQGEEIAVVMRKWLRPGEKASSGNPATLAFVPLRDWE